MTAVSPSFTVASKERHVLLHSYLPLN
uniref:Uncharacterized protein n=1 Tax=Anguilla anguilla TaxID=7936 RepID=A0A0E9T2D7_ANGAN